jgi:group I intron endonuclease
MKNLAAFHNFHKENLEDLFKTGVYTIEFINKPNYYYVGSAVIVNTNKTNSGFYNRWWKHFNELSKNKHHNKILQNICNKYGIENIRFKILEFSEPHLARYLEHYWINILDTKNRNHGYNLGHVSIKGIKFKMSLESNIKKSLLKSKPVLQYNLLGEFITEFPSIKKAAEFTNIKKSAITHALHDTKTGGNFQWKFKTNEIIENIKPVVCKILHTKKVSQFTKDKIFIKEFLSVNDAAEAINVSRPNLIRVLKRKKGGITGIYKNYYWEYS